jgi:hypothetical protein
MKKLLLYAVIGGGIYYLLHKAKETAEAQAAEMQRQLHAVSPLTQAPTDSMMPGAMSGALLGMLNDAPRQHHVRHIKRVAGANSYLGPMRVLR